MNPTLVFLIIVSSLSFYVEPGLEFIEVVLDLEVSGKLTGMKLKRLHL